MFSGTTHIKRFVLDEADEMLSRGFKEQIYDVFRNMNENIQVCIFPSPRALHERAFHRNGVVACRCATPVDSEGRTDLSAVMGEAVCRSLSPPPQYEGIQLQFYFFISLHW